ncbi:MAG TPA: YciI family protein [Nannocystis sp.]
MKFMVMVMVPTSSESEAGVLPDAKELEAMDKFGEEMVTAGVMLAAEGLQPTSRGARIAFSGGTTTVVDGPFTESKELIAGFSILKAKSREEVVAMMRRAPFAEGVTLEVRQLHDPADFASLDPTGELLAKDAVLREQMLANSKLP